MINKRAINGSRNLPPGENGGRQVVTEVFCMFQNCCWLRARQARSGKLRSCLILLSNSFSRSFAEITHTCQNIVSCIFWAVVGLQAEVASGLTKQSGTLPLLPGPWHAAAAAADVIIASAATASNLVMTCNVAVDSVSMNESLKTLRLHGFTHSKCSCYMLPNTMHLPVGAGHKQNRTAGGSCHAYPWLLHLVQSQNLWH